MGRYVDASGYTPPASFYLLDIQRALLALQQAERFAQAEIDDTERFFHRIANAKGEQDPAKQWRNPTAPEIRRYLAVQEARRVVGTLFRKLRTEGQPPNLSLKKMRTPAEREEADLWRPGEKED